MKREKKSSGMMASGLSIAFSNTISFQENKASVTASDKTGFETLLAIQKADKFNKWMFSAVSPYCSGHVLEIGSGIGNISQFFVSGNFSITLSDIDSFYIDILQTRFSNCKNVNQIRSIDLQHPAFEKTYFHLKENFDTLVMLNVMEHLENENIALQNCSYLLKPAGTLILLVPAYCWLYSRMDKELGHKKRYTALRLDQLISRNKFLVKKTFYFNALGIPAWLYGKIRRLKKIPSAEMNVFNFLTGPGKLIDKLLFRKAGLSVINVSKKT
jgi:2-polyprenyl-3-methyl-5-hydroxy-6-metoxy-1,4-benzoquinol methylase